MLTPILLRPVSVVNPSPPVVPFLSNPIAVVIPRQPYPHQRLRRLSRPGPFSPGPIIPGLNQCQHRPINAKRTETWKTVFTCSTWAHAILIIRITESDLDLAASTELLLPLDSDLHSFSLLQLDSHDSAALQVLNTNITSLNV
jgi:hypothetical protein